MAELCLPAGTPPKCIAEFSCERKEIIVFGATLVTAIMPPLRASP